MRLFVYVCYLSVVCLFYDHFYRNSDRRSEKEYKFLVQRDASEVTEILYGVPFARNHRLQTSSWSTRKRTILYTRSKAKLGA